MTEEAEIREIRQELVEFGIDVSKNIDWAQRVSLLETRIQRQQHGSENEEGGEMFDVGLKELRSRLRGIFLLLFLSLGVFSVAIVFIVFGYVTNEAYLYATEAVAFLAFTLAVICTVGAMHMLWRAYLAERSSRKDVQETLGMARDLWRAAC